MPVPPMRGHLPCRDTFAWIQKCPLKAGTTVPTTMDSGQVIQAGKIWREDLDNRMSTGMVKG